MKLIFEIYIKGHIKCWDAHDFLCQVFQILWTNVSHAGACVSISWILL